MKAYLRWSGNSRNTMNPADRTRAAHDTTYKKQFQLPV